MVLDVATVWTRMLSVTAGAAAATGAPGPGTRVTGKAARSWSDGPWLALIDLHGATRAERAAIEPWLSAHVEPLLLVRHVLVAKPLQEDVFVELTPQAIEAMPAGWRDAPRPVLVLLPTRAAAERREEIVDALTRLRIPLTSGGSELWAFREFDLELLAALATLSNADQRKQFRAALEAGQRHLFDQQLPAAEAALLDDLVGSRDDESLDLETVQSLHPAKHPLKVFAAVERAHNRRVPERERTAWSARSVTARVSGQGFPDVVRDVTAEFAAQAPDLLPTELQRIFEASELLEGR